MNHNDTYITYILALWRRIRVALRLGLYALQDLLRCISGIMIAVILFLYASLVLYWWWFTKEVYKKWQE